MGRTRYEASTIEALGPRYRDKQIPDHRADQPEDGRIKENPDAEKQEAPRCQPCKNITDQQINATLAKPA
jgi:hypothetical protein